MVPHDLLPHHLLELVTDAVLGKEVGVGKDAAVEGPLVGNDAGHELANVAQVGLGGQDLAVAGNADLSGGGPFRIVARGKREQGDLVPPADVDDGVWEVDFLDVVEIVFLL